MSWLFSQALVEEYLGDISLDGEQSVPLSGNNTQQAYCAPDKMMGFSRLSRFGMMYKPLTENLGKELLMSYLADFRAKTLVPQEKEKALGGGRSSMWKHMARIIGEVQPRYAFVENSPMLTTRGLGTVLGDLASLGFDAEWGVLSAADVGAKHERERVWILGYANSVRLERDASRHQLFSKKSSILESNWRGSYWNDLPQPYYIRSSDGVAARVDRLKAIGNGQVSLCMATAWKLLLERIENGK